LLLLLLLLLLGQIVLLLLLLLLLFHYLSLHQLLGSQVPDSFHEVLVQRPLCLPNIGVAGVGAAKAAANISKRS